MDLLTFQHSWNLLSMTGSFKPVLIQAGISPWLFIVPLAILVFISYLIRRKHTSIIMPQNNISMEQNKDLREVVEFSRYSGGHPKISEILKPCLIYYQSEFLHICKYESNNLSSIESVGKIHKESILEIRVEDTFNFMKKMTSDRWTEIKDYFEGLQNFKDEDLAFLIIDWQEGINRFQSIFTVESAGNAMEFAVRKRNAVVRICRPPVLQLA